MSVRTEIAIEAIVSKRIKPHNMLGDIKPNVPLSYKAASAKFMKVKPNEYLVSKMIDGEEVENTTVGNAMEAKMEVIEFVVEQAKT